MPRQLPDDARRVREALTDPHALCDALGLLDLPHQRRRDATVIQCPWHADRSPSCSVSLGADGTIRAKCFACDASGDALTLIAAVHQWDVRRDFGRILTRGAELAGINLSTGETAPTSVPAARERGLEPLGADAFAELADALLEMCPIEGENDARAYLEGRGVFELATHWGALPSAPSQLAEVRRELVARFGHDAWLRCGLAHADGPRAGDWLFAEHRLVIPWRAAGVSGSVLSLQRRLLRAPRSRGEPRYVATVGRPATEPYGCEDALEELGEGVELAIVEGALDTLAMRLLSRRARRRRAVVGLPGVAQWETHLATLQRLAEGRTVVLALDADPAGDRHVAEMGARLRAHGAAKVVRSKPTRGKDWCDVLTAPRVTTPARPRRVTPVPVVSVPEPPEPPKDIDAALRASREGYFAARQWSAQQTAEKAEAERARFAAERRAAKAHWDRVWEEARRAQQERDR